jgi:hypothetical protein
LVLSFLVRIFPETVTTFCDLGGDCACEELWAIGDASYTESAR